MDAKISSEDRMTSKCENYKKYTNSLGLNYTVDIRSNKLIDSDRDTNKVYATIGEFENGLIKKLNDFSKNSSFKYRSNLTSKYIQIKCQNCKLFSYWYKNKDDIDI